MGARARRIVKEPEERKAEILDVAEALFQTKGYEATTTGDILAKAGIARGTLYYHFKSKDEIMNAVIERNIERQIQSLSPLLNDTSLNALEKLQRILSQNAAMNVENEEMLDYLHKPENSIMHQKSLVLAVRQAAPLLAQMIRQGIAEGVFHTAYPLELAEYLMVGMNFLFDPSIFPWSREEYLLRMETLADVLETTLRAERGSFAFLKELAQTEMDLKDAAQKARRR